MENMWTAVQGWIISNGSKILIILVVAFVAHLALRRVIEKIVRRFVVSKGTEGKLAEEKRENTLIKIFYGTVHVVLILVVLLTILSEVGIDIGPLIAGAGVIGIAVGFGGQYLIKDLISGFFIILENQFRVGDVINIAGIAGVVEDITLRKTTLRDLDGVVHHVPNGEIKAVSNMTSGISKINLNVGVAYDSDIEKVKELVNKIGQELFEDEEFKNDLLVAPNFLRIDVLGDSSVEVKIVADTRPGAQWGLTGELRKRILEAFRKEGIEIPFPQLVVHK